MKKNDVEMSFDDCIDEALRLWGIQKEKALMADEILIECQKLEHKMNKLLEKAEKIDPKQYEEFIKSFGKEQQNII